MEPKKPESRPKTLTELEQSNYAETQMPFIKRKYPEVFEVIENKIRDLPLVDIGGGQSNYVETFAHQNNVSKYINVDIVEHKNVPQPMSEFVHQDVEEYLLSGVQFPLGVNFSVNGIETAIFPGFENFEHLANQMMSKGNIIFGVKASVDSDVTSLFHKESWKVLLDEDTFFVFEKM